MLHIVNARGLNKNLRYDKAAGLCYLYVNYIESAHKTFFDSDSNISIERLDDSVELVIV